MDRNTELRDTMSKLRSGDFKKVAEANLNVKEAQGPGAPMGAPMGDPMAGGAPMMGAPAPMGMVPPDMMPPADMMPPMDMPPEGGSDAGAIAAEGLSSVALRAMDLLEDNVNGIMASGDISPVDKSDLAALALSSSDAMAGIPPEEIAALGAM